MVIYRHLILVKNHPRVARLYRPIVVPHDFLQPFDLSRAASELIFHD